MQTPLLSRNTSRGITVTRSSESANRKPAPSPLPSHLPDRCKETMVLGGFYRFFHRSFAMMRSHRSISPVTGGATSPSAPWDEHQEARNAPLCGHFLHTQSSLLPICTGTGVSLRNRLYYRTRCSSWRGAARPINRAPEREAMSIDLPVYWPKEIRVISIDL